MPHRSCLSCLWSSSFIMAKAGLRYLSPLLFVAIRLVACAVVLTALMLRTAAILAAARCAKRLLCNCRCTAERYRANGAACRSADSTGGPDRHCAVPYSLADGYLGNDASAEPLRMGQWLGLALGVAGVALVVGEAALESPARFQGLLLAFVGVLGLVAGTLYFGRVCLWRPSASGELRRSSCRPPPWPRWGRGCWKRLMRIGPGLL